jgi:hypothetical protein
MNTTHQGLIERPATRTDQRELFSRICAREERATGLICTSSPLELFIWRI